MNNTLSNMIWLMLEKVTILLGGLVVTMVVARYLGPEEFGTITFGVTVAGFLVVVSQWGASQSIFILSSNKPKQSARIIVYSEKYRAFLYLALWLFFTIFISTMEEFSDSYIIVSLVVFSFIFNGLDIYQFHLNATRRSRVNASETLKGTITSLTIRLLLVLLSAKTIFFVIPYALQNMMVFYGKRKAVRKGVQRKRKKIASIYISSFFSKGRRLCILNSITFIYMKVGAIFIASYLGVEAYSYFNVAYVLSHVWTFIPLAIGTTLLSKALSIRDEYRKYGSLGIVMLTMIFVSMPFVLTFYFFSELLVSVTFGEQYMPASDMLFELSIVALLSTIVWVINRVLAYYEGDKFLLNRTILLFIISIPMNIIMIDSFGVIGAIYSMIIIELFSALILNVFFRNGLIIKILYYTRLKHIKEVW